MRARSFGVEKEFLGNTFIFSQKKADKQLFNDVKIPEEYPDKTHPRWRAVQTEVTLLLSRPARLTPIYRWKITLIGKTFSSGPKV